MLYAYKFWMLLLILVVCSSAQAQTPTTQPTDLANLQQENAMLRSRILALTVQVKNLQQELAAVKQKMAAPSKEDAAPAGFPSKKSRMAELTASIAHNNWDATTKRNWLTQSSQMLDVIEKYIKTNSRPKEIQAALYKLEPTLGMSEQDTDAILSAWLTVFGNTTGNNILPGNTKKVASESAGQRIIAYRINGTPIDITFENNEATNISR